jgi:hypothetical protein
VVSRDSFELFTYPERHFGYDGVAIKAPLVEALLTPFHLDGRPVGTLWTIAHEPGRHFDGEDVRLLARISAFVALVYKLGREASAVRELRSEAERRNVALRLAAARQQETLDSLVAAVRRPLGVLRNLSRHITEAPLSGIDRRVLRSIVDTQLETIRRAVEQAEGSEPDR